MSYKKWQVNCGKVKRTENKRTVRDSFKDNVRKIIWKNKPKNVKRIYFILLIHVNVIVKCEEKLIIKYKIDLNRTLYICILNNSNKNEKNINLK